MLTTWIALYVFFVLVFFGSFVYDEHVLILDMIKYREFAHAALIVSAFAIIALVAPIGIFAGLIYNTFSLGARRLAEAVRARNPGERR